METQTIERAPTRIRVGTVSVVAYLGGPRSSPLQPATRWPRGE